VTSAGPAAGDDTASAGRLLREARERQGLHIAALAAAIKVQPKKLEALEADRHDLLPDATFVRALAQTVCRALKIDAAEVLRRLPPLATARLGPVGESLSTPFRDRPTGPLDRSWRATAAHPAVWVTVLILAAAAAVLLWPEPLSNGDRAASRTTPGGALVPATSAPSATTASETAPAPPAAMPADGAALTSAGVTSGPAATTPVAAVPPLAGTGERPTAPAAASAESASGAAAAEPAGTIVVRVRADSWVGITDARGAALLGRTLKAGEAVGLEGTAPFKVRIGNAAGTGLAFRGQPVDLAPHTRDNVARLDLR
jgi:cytoskeleton protein RodZ